MLRVLDHFRERQVTREAKEEQRRKWYIAARERSRIKKERLEEAYDEFLDLAVGLLADPIEVKAFQEKLDTYDEATVKALMENQKQLDAINEKIEEMLERAHKLEDGRRVFKTKDGKRVFDEHGTAVSAEVIHPDQIPNDAPYWEVFKSATDERTRLRIERRKIHEFQEKLDHARDRSSADDFTKDELDELEKDLAASLPPSVAEHLPTGMRPSAEPDLSRAFKSPAAPIQISTATVGPSIPELR